MKVYITQLIYINPGHEKVFDEFEALAIPLISKYNGELMMRIRPTKETFIEVSVEKPYEIHLVVFDSESDFKNFMNDESRKAFLHLKAESVKSSFLIKGNEL